MHRQLHIQSHKSPKHGPSNLPQLTSHMIWCYFQYLLVKIFLFFTHELLYVYYPNISGFYLVNDFYLNSNITGEQTLWLKSFEMWDFLSGSAYVQFYVSCKYLELLGTVTNIGPLCHVCLPCSNFWYLYG